MSNFHVMLRNKKKKEDEVAGACSMQYLKTGYVCFCILHHCNNT
jgi:hypothetical protein